MNRAGCILLIGSLWGCGASFDADPDGGAGGVDGGRGGDGGIGGSSSKGGSTAGGGGAGGMASSGLEDAGLLARYFMNEGDTGEASGMLMDASGHDAHLAITSSSNMSWTSESTGRGLRWLTPQGDGMAAASLAGTSLEALDLATDLTFEIVAGPAASTNQGVRLFHVGSDQTGDVAFSLTETHNPSLRLKRNIVVSYGAVSTLDGRRVYHWVVELGAASAVAVRLYVDGVRQTGAPSNPPAAVAVNVAEQLVVGNRPSADRAPNGEIFYLAIYGRVLTVPEINANSARLLASDDP